MHPLLSTIFRLKSLSFNIRDGTPKTYGNDEMVSM